MHENDVFKVTRIRTQAFIFFAILLCVNGIVAVAASTYGVHLDRAGVWPWNISLGLIVGFILLIVDLLVIVWFLDKKSQPLEELTAFASRLGRGDLYSRVYIKDNTELGHLAYHLNTMADQLSSQIESLKKSNDMKHEFIAISSHNLQTPLVVIKGYLEQLSEKSYSYNEEQQHALDGIGKQTNRLSNIANRLIQINQLQGELVGIHRHPTDLTALTQDVVDNFQAYARSKNITLEYSHPNHPIMLEIDAHWITYVWQNLLDNAIKYTDDGGNVNVVIGTNEKAKVFGEIKDTGIGIPSDETEDLFQPFHRSQHVLDASYEGFGLGLYGVKLVVERHKGSVFIQSEEDKGTTVRFTFDQ